MSQNSRHSDPVLGVGRSVRGRRWLPRLADDRAALALSQAADVPEIVGRIAAGRGVGSADAEDFFRPTLRRLMPDPAVLRDCEAAADRLAEAVVKGETIGLFADYDVDGATASALMRLYFEAVGATVLVHIPDRQSEGYGPNRPAMARLAAAGAAMVVTLDCGITAHQVLAECHDAGEAVIVVDHHLAEPALPPAVAVVNPNRLDDQSGLGQLAAVGVAFMVLVAVNRALRRRGLFDSRREPDLIAWLDLVALGTVCDIVPLTGLNRALVVQGLRVLARRQNIGLAALSDVAGLDSRPEAYHLGFLLGPRINAGGRVGEAGLGHALLTSDDPDEARRLALRLDGYNRERRAIESLVVEAAMARAAVQEDEAVIMVCGEGWHPGVIGLAASRLSDRYDRPALVVGLDGDIGKGSARSVPGFDIGALVTAARQAGVLINGGGHAMAAGLTVARDHLESLQDFVRRRGASLAETLGPPALKLDGILAPGAATPALLAQIEKAAPFGSANPAPRFGFGHLTVTYAERVGEDHVRCTLSGDDGTRLPAIAFRVADEPLGRLLLEARGDRLHLAGALRADKFGKRGVQLQIHDAARPETSGLRTGSADRRAVPA